MRTVLALASMALALRASAQQLPRQFVQRLAAPPFGCSGPSDLALVPCGRSRIADECRFRLAHLGECGPIAPAVAAARSALQACTRESNPEAGGNLAMAFLTYDKAVAAAAAAASPSCKYLRGVPSAPGGPLDRWNAAGAPASWLPQVKAECARLGKLVPGLRARAAALDKKTAATFSRELDAAQAGLGKCARISGSGQSALAGGFAHSAGQALERARRIDLLAPRSCAFGGARRNAASPKGVARRQQQQQQQPPPGDDCKAPPPPGLTLSLGTTPPGRVWLPDTVPGEKIGLVIYLHGQIHDGSFGAGRVLADDAQLRRDSSSNNISNLARFLIRDGKMGKVAIAAPTEKPQNLTTDPALWTDFDLSVFVAKVLERAADRASFFKGAIDLDRVTVVGHSGAGVWECTPRDDKCGPRSLTPEPHRFKGLMSVAHRRGSFRVGNDDHELMLIGLADTWVHGAYAEDLLGWLNKAFNRTTQTYAVFKGSGGHNDGNAEQYAAGFGLRHNLDRGALPSAAEQEDRATFDFYRDNAGSQTRRTVARVAVSPKSGVRLHEDEFLAMGATARGRSDHDLMPLVWSWYALPRFYPPGGSTDARRGLKAKRR